MKRLLISVIVNVCYLHSTAQLKGLVMVLLIDTIAILDSANNQIRMRLYGIDCPEHNQDFGTVVKKYTSAKCYKKKVYIIEHGKDKYQRQLGEVILPSGDTINKILLIESFAWHYKYFDKSKDYADLEEEARKEKRGLWVVPEPVAPWEFRINRTRNKLNAP